MSPPTSAETEASRSGYAPAHAPVQCTLAPQPVYDMDSYMPLLMLTLCACTRGEPLRVAMRRSDLQYAYAREFARGYKPITYAALSLHSPIPILHIMSRVPPFRRPDLENDLHTAASGVMSTYAHPYSPYMYATSMSNFIHDNFPDSDEPTVLYARPNPQGGYTYRRRPTKKRVPRPEPEPIIIRVHKYKIIRDR